MKPEDDIKKSFKNAGLNTNPQMDQTVLDKILKAREKTMNSKSANLQPNIRSIIMRSRLSKLAAAAVIIIAAVLFISIFDKTIPTASAVQVLQEAARAVSNLRSVYIEAKMRTRSHDNFASIQISHDFVPIEMWKRVDETGFVQWRIEKPLRVAVMDGEKATLLVRQTWASSGRCPGFQCYDCDWCGQLMNVDGLLDSELQKVQQQEDAELCLRHENIDGCEKLVLEIETLAQGDYTNDYIKNKFISDSNHKRIYYFDAETKLLESFEIYVHADDRDVLIFEITNIEYDLEIEDNLFTLELPENVIWWQSPEILPDNEKYAQMDPQEAAIAFFTACAEENCEEFLKFSPASAVDPRIK